MGAPQLHRITAATIQMAKFYNLPARGGCALTDAHFPDAQAGYESALSLSTAVNAGSNFILHAAGMLGAYAEMSFEKFIIDEELCRLVLASCRPLEVSDDAIDIEMIKEVGIGGEYLTHPATFELCRNGFFISRIANRQGYAQWHESGSKHIIQKATEGEYAIYDLMPNAKDHFGIWENASEHVDPDYYITADGKSGIIIRHLQEGAPYCMWYMHWQGLNPENGVGWEAFKTVTERIEKYLSDQVVWMRPSDIVTHYHDAGSWDFVDDI